VTLDGEKYQKVLARKSFVTSTLLENYRVWFRDGLRDRKDLDDAGRDRLTDERLKKSSTTLFDTVAVYLAVSRDLVQVKSLPIRITDDGFTRVEQGAKTVDCAVQWNDLDGYESWLVQRLAK
jgi:hypothetical protein